MPETPRREGRTVDRSLLRFLLIAPLLLWPPILIYKDGILAFLPILAGCYGAAFSLVPVEDWRTGLLPFTLGLLGIVVIAFLVREGLL